MQINMVESSPTLSLAAKTKAAFNFAYTSTVGTDDGFFALNGMSGKKYRLFINTLINSIEDAHYLEIGVWTGSTFCSAIYNNQVKAVAIDNWSQFGGPKELFISNLSKFQTPQATISIIENDFRQVDYSSMGKFNVYLFDGPHNYQDQYDGIVLVQNALNETFVLIVDDWNWRRVRYGTLSAIRHLGLNTIFSVEIRTTLDESYPDFTGKQSDWHNGYLIAVLER